MPVLKDIGIAMNMYTVMELTPSDTKRDKTATPQIYKLQ